ncbi:plasmid pRiA4b ORF-3 family protein [Clostridium beijerinckii]|uniref:Plasmid pRiA4b ORF-3 family protein n=1 Tax=Clostridium beijerinckii TaxID=1520 RepID=A0AAW3WDW9_CLOBE|nr:plasmid pRiA4b ORF-3 family protein [Clostridium beijerinckii]MBC2459640.1 plasmid pRiA4b ORF-3 family protein [Clostridium beijerinckii]MBC2477135.1 plasmid pRiA4b ORF-3 family protein [Clostridium beijerinckii]NOV60433.1 hypothetical protein [Clostridium beijerinckii]NOV70791.1 hypothetical protein [Clostridium beijerinckii]NOW33708.1 hypothetical protein [Clostridium beijerinckii]
MFIECTKKLQDEMGITVEKPYEDKELFSWSANLINIKRRKAVVLVNNSSRFGFVLFGLKAKDFKRLDELILQGVRRCFQSEKIKEEIIEQYLSDAGTICFSKTNGSRYVSRLNKACEVVGYFEELLDLENIYQPKITRKLNTDIIKIDKYNYKQPYELLLKDLKENYRENIVKCEGVKLVVKLDLGSYCAERKIIIPIDINFKELHEILQISFGWKNYHLYEFNVINEEGENVLNVVSEHEDAFYPNGEYTVAIDSDTFIKDYMKKEYTIIYNYDFGDNWEHEIKIDSIIPDYDKNYPICIAGMENAPPEDVGGIPGYEKFLEIMSNPNHSEYEETKLWSDINWNKNFRMDLVNKRLKYALRN